MHTVIDFVEGNEYVTDDGVSCKCLSTEKDWVTVQYRNSQLRLRKMMYAGVYMAVRAGAKFLLSAPIVPIVEEDDDDGFKPTVAHKKMTSKLNLEEQLYLNLYKEHKSHEES